jgi:predicted nucleic acid-binding Zn ribbon protein
MPTYVYQIIDTLEEVEIEQSISAKPLTVIEHNGRVCSVKRIIAGSANFILKGGCWGRDNYSHGIQSPAQEMKELKQWERSQKK